MRTTTRIAAVAAAAGLAAAAVAAPASAAKPDWAKKSSSSIVETAIGISTLGGFDDNHADFDILIQALLATGVVGIFDGTDYTVFAPTDQAFMDTLGIEEGAGAEEAAFDAAVSALGGVDGVSNVLAYHVTDGVRNSKSVTKAKKITMLNGGTISARSGMVEAGSTTADFVGTDIRVSDGMIHVIDTVLLP
jgi:uncharacterized surface protein with fasciclin (FAS1) repeats